MRDQASSFMTPPATLDRTARMGALLASVALAFLAGCGGKPVGPNASIEAQTPEEVLASAIGTLKDDRPTTSTYRSAVQQLNNYLDLKREVREQLVVDARLRGLIDGGQLALDRKKERLEELERKSFTPLDAYHLDACFLFRDAAKALKNDVGPEPTPRDPARADYDLRLARHAFEWVVRQVYLQPRIRNADDPRAQELLARFRLLGPERTRELGIRNVLDVIGVEFWPPHEVLRRGTGDAEERRRVCLALLQQLKLDGCVVSRVVEVQNEDRREPRELTWAVGVRIGKDVYLFDPLLGVPVPGPGGKGIATLRQAKQDPAILQALYEPIQKDPDRLQSLALAQLDSTHPVPVTAAQLSKAAVLLPNNLAAISPRMKELQTWLEDENNPVLLHEDLPAILERYRAADLDAEVRLWSTRTGYPTVVTARYVEDPLSDFRRLSLLAPRQALMPGWVHQLATDLGTMERSELLYERFDSLLVRARAEPGGVRDLLVRGKPELAVERILDMEYRLDKALDVFHQQVNEDTTTSTLRDHFGKQMVAMERERQALIVQRQKLSQPGADTRQLDEQIRQLGQGIEGQWLNNQVGLIYMSMHWSSPEIRDHLTYFMGLAKLEMAIRAEMHAGQRAGQTASAEQLTPAQRWASAAEWFDRYQALTAPSSRNNWGQAAQAHLALCRARLAQLASK